MYLKLRWLNATDFFFFVKDIEVKERWESQAKNVSMVKYLDMCVYVNKRVPINGLTFIYFFFIFIVLS
jgi:hypothetical protein